MLDVIMATYGACDAAKLSVEALLKHASGYKLHIYDNPASQLDGTRDWLCGQANRINLICGDKNLSHGAALDRLVSCCSQDWILTVDSDLVIEAGAINCLTKHINDKVNVIGEIRQLHGSRRLSNIMMARPEAKLCLFRRQWFVDNNLSWCTKRVSLRMMFPELHKQLWGVRVKHLFCDTGWQLFLLGTASESIKHVPSLHRHYKHLRGASSRFKRDNWKEIKARPLV